MTDFLTQIGFNLTNPLGVFRVCTAWTFLAITVIWIVGNFQTDHSMMDGYYGFGYAIPVWIAATKLCLTCALMIGFRGAGRSNVRECSRGQKKS